jgi:hypothetical protein
MDRQPYSGVFAETRAFVAIMEGDEDTAREILDDSYPNERRTLIAALNRLSALAHGYCDKCGKRVDSFTDLVTLGVGKGSVQVCRDCADTVRAEQEALMVIRRQVAAIVHEAVMLDDSGYITVAAVVGIPLERVMDLRDRRVDATEDEVAKLRAFITERTG